MEVFIGVLLDGLVLRRIKNETRISKKVMMSVGYALISLFIVSFVIYYSVL